MSETRKPFAWVDACHDGSIGFEFINRFSSDDLCIYIAADGCNDEASARYKVDTINAAVERERREAAAKALRAFADSEALKDDFGHGEVVTKHDVRTALRAEADQVEKGGAS